MRRQFPLVFSSFDFEYWLGRPRRPIKRGLRERLRKSVRKKEGQGGLGTRKTKSENHAGRRGRDEVSRFWIWEREWRRREGAGQTRQGKDRAVHSQEQVERWCHWRGRPGVKETKSRPMGPTIGQCLSNEGKGVAGCRSLGSELGRAFWGNKKSGLGLIGWLPALGTSGVCAP